MTMCRQGLNSPTETVLCALLAMIDVLKRFIDIYLTHLKSWITLQLAINHRGPLVHNEGPPVDGPGR